MRTRKEHISPRPPEERRAVFGFTADATGVPQIELPDGTTGPIIPVELSLQPGHFARCLFGKMHAWRAVAGDVRVQLEYCVDEWDTADGARVWTSVFASDSTKLTITSGNQQMRGLQQNFTSGSGNPLDLRNGWANASSGTQNHCVLIRPTVEVASNDFVVCELVMEIRPEYR